MEYLTPFMEYFIPPWNIQPPSGIFHTFVEYLSTSVEYLSTFVAYFIPSVEYLTPLWNV